MTGSTNTIADRIQDATERKAEGNDHFRQSRWAEALIAYRSGLARLPKRAPSPVMDSRPLEDYDGDVPPVPNGSNLDVPASEVTEPPLEDEDQDVAQLRSVLFANVGACHVKLGEHKEAVDACTEALKDNPSYEKALQRRAASNEIIDTWSSLSAAKEDYTTLKELVNPSQKAEVEAKLKRLAPRLDVAQKRETAEMVEKMKGFGNSILGRFGLSTDNFKFEPNGQGGYSMNFVQ